MRRNSWREENFPATSFPASTAARKLSWSTWKPLESSFARQDIRHELPGKSQAIWKTLFTAGISVNDQHWILALVLFVASMSAGLISNFVMFAIVGEVNRKL